MKFYIIVISINLLYTLYFYKLLKLVIDVLNALGRFFICRWVTIKSTALFITAYLYTFFNSLIVDE